MRLDGGSAGGGGGTGGFGAGRDSGAAGTLNSPTLMVNSPEGLKDPVDVAAAFGGYLDDRQARANRLLDPGDRLAIIRFIDAGNCGEEEPARVTNSAGCSRSGCVEDERPIGVAVRLSRDKAEMIIALAELVDQIPAVDAIGVVLATGAE